MKTCLDNKDVVKTLNGIKFSFKLEDSKKYIKDSCSNKDSYEFPIIYDNKYAFNKLNLKKVWAGIISNNPASGRVLEKAGFKLEGKQEKQVFQNNRYYDELLYGFLRA